MKYLPIIILLFFCAGYSHAQQDSLPTPLPDSLQVSEEPVQHDEKKIVTFSASPSLGITFNNIDNSGDEETLTLQWIAGLQSRFGYEGNPLQFNASIFAQFGQLVTKENSPKKIQDNLLVTAVPSLILSDQLGLRIFFEVTGETEMGRGVVDDTIPSNFLDPLFLYETLFIGHKTNYQSDDGAREFQFTLGVGYAYQQTITNHFVLEQNRNFVIDQNNPLQGVQDQFTLEHGYSAILDIFYKNALSDNAAFKTSLKTVALTKKDFFNDITACRVGSLLLTGFSYSFLSLDYTLRIVYDNNISTRRQLEQSLVFGVKFEI